jgi:hypothetical protein
MPADALAQLDARAQPRRGPEFRKSTCLQREADIAEAAKIRIAAFVAREPRLDGRPGLEPGGIEQAEAEAVARAAKARLRPGAARRTSKIGNGRNMELLEPS